MILRCLLAIWRTVIMVLQLYFSKSPYPLEIHAEMLMVEKYLRFASR